jgi:surface antigen
MNNPESLVARPCIQGYISIFMRALGKLHEVRTSVARNAKIVNQKVNKHLSSFHALHSSMKMSRLDYTFKFSTELMVVTLSVVVIGFNVLGSAHMASANNLFTRLLAYHPDKNPSLYAKTTTIKTVIAQDNSVIIPSASAQVVLASTDAQTTQPASFDNQSDSIVNNNTIQKENPDSVRKMIADQIKVYDTVSGDTLQSVSTKFNVSVDTIKWANNLQSDSLKPGWNLVILPTSGVLHKVTNNDTLGDIAKKYNADINQIISYNGLKDESDITPGDLLIIPGGSVAAPAPSAPKQAPIRHVLAGNKVVYEPSQGITNYGGGHLFPWGQCTYYASKKRGGVPWGGDARYWLQNAKAYGARTGRNPIAGAIVVFSGGRRGHVGIVEKVGNGDFTIGEMNWDGLGVVDHRSIATDQGDIKGFIY